MIGIRTIKDLKDRCRVEGKCWHWAGGNNGGGQPSLWMPALGRHVTLGVAIGFLKTGEPPVRGVFWFATCCTTGCANPAHRETGDRSAYMLAAKLQRDAVVRARIAATKRAHSSLDEDAVRDIRFGTGTLKEAAARHGIHPSYASLIRRGRNRRELAARGASVFNLGG